MRKLLAVERCMPLGVLLLLSGGCLCQERPSKTTVGKGLKCRCSKECTNQLRTGS